MEEFFSSIENHKETALYVALFLWIMTVNLRGVVVFNKRSK